MRVLLTGQVGLDKSEYLQDAQELARGRGKNLDFESIGPLMIENYAGEIPEAKILNLQKVFLDTLRTAAWKDILRQSERIEAADHFVVNTHAVFRWSHGLFPALDLEWVSKYRPDLVIVLIDDITRIKAGMKARGTDVFKLWELFAWREEEVWFSKSICDSVRSATNSSTEFYVLPKAQGSNLLVRILERRGDQPKRVYLSFPMTGISDLVKEEIDAFKEEMRANFITFDPGGIADRNLITTYNTVAEEIREQCSDALELVSGYQPPEGVIWGPHVDNETALCLVEMRFADSPGMSLLGRELQQAFDTIDSQIISRDYLLIDQSDLIIIFIRADENGSPLISAGCQSELRYAYETGKEVFGIFSGDKNKLSPWVTQFSAVFSRVDVAKKYVLEKYTGR